jgi:hypothetical protein
MAMTGLSVCTDRSVIAIAFSGDRNAIDPNKASAVGRGGLTTGINLSTGRMWGAYYWYKWAPYELPRSTGIVANE